METDAEVHNQALCQASIFQLEKKKGSYEQGASRYWWETHRENWPELAGAPDSEKAVRQPALNWPRCSASGWELCSFVCSTAPSSGTRTCPWCMSWLFGTYSLRCDALPSRDAVGMNLVLPQLDLPCFVDSHGRTYPFWMKTERKWIVGGVEGRWGREWEERRKGKLWLICKILIKSTVIATKQSELEVW